MPACRCVMQDCSNKSNPRIGISLHTPKSNNYYELASGNPSFALTVPTLTPRGFSRSAQFISHPTALSGPFI